MAALERGLNILRGLSVRGRLIFSVPVGSRLYDLCVDHSDEDWLLCYAGRIEDFFALEKEQKPPAIRNDAKKDVTVNEVEHVCNLILEGKTKVIEALFADCEAAYESEAWLELKAMREEFLTLAVFREYVGFAKSQLKQAMHEADESKRRKKLMHIHRLSFECARLLEGRAPHVRMRGEERERLMVIRRGEVGLRLLEDEATSIVRSLEYKLTKPDSIPLRKEVAAESKARLERWLLKIRFSMVPATLPEGDGGKPPQ